MIDNMRVLALRAEHDDFRIRVDAHVVPGRPIEEVVLVDGLLAAGGIGGGDLAAQHEAPVRAVAAVSFQSLEQGGRIDTSGQREVFATDLPITICVAEIHFLANSGTGDLHLYVDFVLGNPHLAVSSLLIGY